MEEIILRYIEVFGILGGGIGALIFGWKQHQINKRMQELNDYVAISIVPAPKEGGAVRILNVGRSNLYLHRWEIGQIGTTFNKPILLPTAGRSSILITANPPQIGVNLSKFYLTDEKEQKYLATGEVQIDQIPVQVPIQPPQLPNGQQQINMAQGTPMQVVNVFKMRVWAYKTEKFDWLI